jgi:hypothetical protein
MEISMLTLPHESGDVKIEGQSNVDLFPWLQRESALRACTT